MSTANLDSADLKGVAAGGLISEDVMKQIVDISKIPLPFLDMLGEPVPVKNSYAEWTQDEAQAVDLTNAAIDGQDITGDDSNTGTRVGNHCQISYKVVRVSTRARNSDVIGQSDSLAYQIMMRIRELRNDMEGILLSDQASVADDGSATAGKVGGLGAWLETNAYRGATGADGGFNTATKVVDAPTDGTIRALSEATVRDCAQDVYNNGGNVDTLMTNPAIKRKFSEHLLSTSAKIATLSSDIGQQLQQAKAIGAVDVFLSDFDTLKMVPNRKLQAYATNNFPVFLLDPELLQLGFLHGFKDEEQGKTGLADNRQITVDYTLKVLTEKGLGVVADIDQTAAATA